VGRGRQKTEIEKITTIGTKVQETLIAMHSTLQAITNNKTKYDEDTPNLTVILDTFHFFCR